MTVTAYIALGSNLGDRHDYLDRSLADLRQQPGISISAVSAYYETEPVGGPAGQPAFLNAAARLETDLEPQALLHVLQSMEQSLGRVRREHHGPRTLDLDLLLYGDRAFSTPDLTVPHPRLHERRFVLEPLAEIAPQATHPVLGKSIGELLQMLKTTQRVERVRESAAPGRELAGRTVLVTGSTSGIGKAIALELAAAGANMIVHGRRSAKAAEEVAGQARQAGVKSQVILADLRNRDEREHLLQTAWATGRVDIWVNNAGADTLTGPALSWSFERKLEELLAVDVTATMHLSRACGERMRAAAAGGVLLNMGWDQAEIGMEGDSGQLFAATKAAVMAFSKSLALTLAPEVRVNCLAPGWIRTAWGDIASQLWQDRVLRETPLRRWGTPQDVAAAARWLVSPAASFLTGQVIYVNGGAVRS